MKDNKRPLLGAAAMLIALAGCTSGSDSNPPATSTPAATSSPVESAAPTAPSTAAAQPSEGVSASVLSVAESCRVVLADQAAALGTISDYVRNPLSGDVSVEQLEQLRAELHADELSAPDPLRPHLNRQVGVLNSVVEGIQEPNVEKVDVAAFREAGKQIQEICSAETR